MPETKVCSKCDAEYPLTIEYFKPAKMSKDGFYGQCRTCVSRRGKLYREKNQEHIKEQDRIYRQEHKEQRAEYQRKYREENRESYQEHARKYRVKTRQRRYSYNKDYIANNKEYWDEWYRKYRQKHSTEENIKTQRYRAKKRNLPNTLTKEQWDKCKQYFNNTCAYCGMPKKRLTQDHFIAVDNGGEYSHNNIVPACKSCNSSKQNTDFFKWYPKKKFYSKARERSILEFLGYNKKHQQQLTLI